MRAEDVNISQAPAQVVPEAPAEKKSETQNPGASGNVDVNAGSDDELYQRYISRRGLCKTQDFVVVGIMIAILTYVWVKIYKQPIPPMILQLLGMDDPVFEKQ